MLVESFHHEENLHIFQAFSGISFPFSLIRRSQLTVHSYFVPRHIVINPEQNCVLNGCQTCCYDVAFNLNHGLSVSLPPLRLIPYFYS